MLRYIYMKKFILSNCYNTCIKTLHNYLEFLFIDFILIVYKKRNIK